MELLILVLNIMGNKVIKVIRIVTGKLVSGNVAVPIQYRQGLNNGTAIRIYADYSANELGKKAVFLININANDISLLQTSTPTTVNNNSNWTVIGICEVTQNGSVYSAYVDLNPSQVGICGFASYCPQSEFGNNINVEF
jgi:hypothetical protein